MSKFNEDPWGVKVTINKKKAPSSPISKPVVRQVTFQSSKSANQSEDSSEQVCKNLLKMLNDSRKVVEMEGCDVMQSVRKWQQTTIARFDSLQKHLDRMHDLETASANDRKHSSGRQMTNFLSLPVLTEDTENEDSLDNFLATPPAPLPSIGDQFNSPTMMFNARSQENDQLKK